MAVFTDFDPSFTMNFVNSGCVAGTTSTITTTVTTAGCINGKFVTTYAAASNAASPTTDAATGTTFLPLSPNQCCVLLIGQTAAGALQMCQGQIISTATGVTTTVGAFILDPQFPSPPNNFLPLAYTIVRTAPSAATWTPGSSSWTASGVSATTFQNISVVPSRPQSS